MTDEPQGKRCSPEIVFHDAAQQETSPQDSLPPFGCGGNWLPLWFSSRLLEVEEMI